MKSMVGVGMLAMSLAVLPGTASSQSSTPTTLVTLTFDDTNADQYQTGAPILAKWGMNATFFVNSGRVGLPNFMTQAQILALQDAGHEIGGHTVTHVDLPTYGSDDDGIAFQQREVCDDRAALVGLGFNVTSFAYPFGDTNATTEGVVSGCGYNSARGVGNIVSAYALPDGGAGVTCFGCAYAENIPPSTSIDIWHTKTPDSIKQDTTLAMMENYITQAQQNGGGWVEIVMHHVCDGPPPDGGPVGGLCNEYAISPENLDAFLSFIADAGVSVQTVQQVVGGAQQPTVSGPPLVFAVSGNLLANPSLESSSAGLPTCWGHGGTGTVDSSAWDASSDSYDGVAAQQLDIYADSTGGIKRLYSQQPTSLAGVCKSGNPPQIRPGHSYTVKAHYIATSSNPFFTIYAASANDAGQLKWSFLTQTPTKTPLPLSASYTEQSLTILPDGGIKAFFVDGGNAYLSVALSLGGVGEMIMDAFSVEDGDTQPPLLSIAAPLDGTTISGNTKLVANADDSSTGNNGISWVDFYVNGTNVGAATYVAADQDYELFWDTTQVSDAPVAITAKAQDGVGNTAVSTSVLVTVANSPPADTQAPILTLTSPDAGSATNGTLLIAASATDDVAVEHIDFLVGGSLVATSTCPTAAQSCSGSVSWDSTTTSEGSVSIQANAFDTSGLETSQSVTIYVDRTAPTVSLTAPQSSDTVSGVYSFQATASDDVAVASVQFIVNDNSATPACTSTTSPYSCSWDSSSLANGSATVSATAFDTAGNSTSTGDVTVSISNSGPDTTPPVTTIACNDGGCGNWFDGSVSVTLSATDRTGVVSTVYTTDGTDPTLDGGTGILYSGAFTVSSTTTVEYASTDDAGNVEAAKTQLIQIDSTPPSTTALCNGAACVAWYDAPVSVTLTATDNVNGSGVGLTVYTVNGSSPSVFSTQYRGAFTVSQNTTVQFLSWDVAGNQEQVESFTLNFNSVPPSASIACNAACSSSNCSCSSGWYTQPVAVSFCYTGSGAPQGGVKYTIDGTTPGPDSGILYNGSPISLSQITAVNFSAFDVAGNYEAVQTQTFYVDTKAPTGVFITSPADGGSILGKAAYIVPNPAATDNVGIWSYTYYRDCAADGTGGVRLGSRVNTPTRWSWYWDAGGGLPTGTHTLCVHAADDAGNSTLSPPIVVDVE